MPRPAMISVRPAPRGAWGGWRPGAGRPTTRGASMFVAHRARPEHDGRAPVLVTLRTLPVAAVFARESLQAELREHVRASERSGFHVRHAGFESDRVLAIVEAPDADALRRGVQGLAIRLARGVNRTLGRTGRVWSERYDTRVLGTELALREAILDVRGRRR